MKMQLKTGLSPRRLMMTFFSCGAIVGVLALTGSGCSSSQTSDSDLGDDVPAADAGTDAVPPANADGETAASADTNATPPPGDSGAPPAQADASAAPPPDANGAAAPPPPVTAEAPATPPIDNKPPEATTPPVVADTSHESSSDSGSGETEKYHVRSGDTLMRIAFEKYGDLYKWKSIYEANRGKIKDPNIIMPGTVLVLENVKNDIPTPSGKKYSIKSGDTLGTISNDVYGTPSKWRKLWEHNKAWIPNPNKIFAGFFLYYTGGKAPEDIEEKDEQENSPPPMAEDPQQQAPQQPPVAELPREPASTTMAPTK